MPRTIHAPIDQARRERRQDWSIDRWCLGLKISRQKLEHHPHFGDLITLLMYDEYDQWLSEIDRTIWRHCWHWVYHWERPLSEYQRSRLISILTHISLRQATVRHIRQRQARKQSRLGRVENGVKITTIKGSAHQI